jgi:hypothetical protein
MKAKLNPSFLAFKMEWGHEPRKASSFYKVKTKKWMLPQSLQKGTQPTSTQS